MQIYIVINAFYIYLECVDGGLRLADGTNYGDDNYKGRVEVFYNGVWGTICNDIYGVTNVANTASVICKQLGYSTVVANWGHNDNGHIDRTTYGQGTGQIWLDDLNCAGTESLLTDCSHLAWGTHNCVHAEDISIHCSGYLGNGTYSFLHISVYPCTQ